MYLFNYESAYLDDTGVENMAIMTAARPSSNNIVDVHFCIADDLNIYRKGQFSVSVIFCIYAT